MNNPAKKFAGLIVLLLLSIFSNLYSQATSLHVFQEWAGNVGLTDQVYKSSSVHDASDNLYIAGGTINANGDYDWLISAYNKDGDLLWTFTYDTAALNDYAIDIAVDGANNALFITGAITIDTAQGMDLGIIMLDLDGNLQWVNSYDNGQSYPFYNDGGASVTIDNNGYVYVAGGTTDPTTLEDYLTIQYDYSGAQQWIQIYDAYNLQDGAGHINFNGTNVVVTGMVQKEPDYHGISALEYDPGGTLVGGTGLSTTDLDSITAINDITIATNGDIYVSGYLYNPSTGRNAKVIKLDTNLTVRWQFNSGFSGDDEANTIKVDNYGAFYVGGYTTSGTGMDYLFAKLDTAGNLIWGPASYNGPINGDEELEAIALDNQGNPIFTGYVETDTSNFDYYTLKYDTAGTLLWGINYNGLNNKIDKATAITVDPNNDIYVIGQSQDSSGFTSQYITVKYVEHELYVVPATDTIPSSFEFIPNWGQLLNADTITNVNSEVTYYSTSTSTYFETGKIIHVFGELDTSDATLDTLVRVDMVLSTDTAQRVYSLERKSNYHNFFFSHLSATKGLANVPCYSQLVYPEIYPKINMNILGNVRGVMEQFVIKPGGGNASSIEFKYSGADTIYLNGSGDLVIATIIDTLIYKRPTCSQIDSSGNYVSIGWQPIYEITSDTIITFDSIQTYNTNLPLILEMNQGDFIYSIVGPGDPLEWSTFFTGAGTTKIYDIDKDETGNIFAAGTTFNLSLPGIVGVTGQNNFTTGTAVTAFYTKIKSDLSVEYNTYFGGNGDDIAYGISATKWPIIVGMTKSSNLMDGNNSGLDYDALRGTQDGFVAVFNYAGTGILSDSYIGGDGKDWCMKVDQTTDAIMAIVGYTESSSNFPIVTSTNSGAYNQPYKGGTETFIVNGSAENFGFSGSSPWITFFGGAGYDRGVDINIGDNYEVWLFGYTNTDASTANSSPCTALSNPNTDFCICTIGTPSPYNQTSYGGGWGDMYLAEFIDQKLVWSTYVGGVGNEFNSYGDLVIHPIGGMDVKYSADPDEIEIAIGGETNALYFESGVAGVPYNTINGSSYSYSNYTEGNWGMIGKFINHSLKWFTLFGGTNDQAPSDAEGTYITDVDFSTNGSLMIVGSTEVENNQALIDYCSTPTSGEYPLCDLTGNAHFEDDYHVDNVADISNGSRRSFIAAFGSDGKLYWSTKYGNRPENSITCATTSSDGKLYIGGFAITAAGFGPLGAYPYTLEDYNVSSTVDHFDSFDYGVATVGTLARFTINDIIGIENIENTYNLALVYPNPTSDMLNVKLNTAETGDIVVQIFDLTGKNAKSFIINSQNGVLQFNVSELATGMYLLRMTQNCRIFNGKFVKE